jgi:hypothetical protein
MWWEGLSLPSLSFCSSNIGSTSYNRYRRVGRFIAYPCELGLRLHLGVCPNDWFGGHDGRLIIFILPILIWIAARYCPLESAIANGIVAGFAIWSFVQDCGPFSHSHAPTYVVNGFILIQCVGSLAVCTLLAEKRDEQENSLICNLELKTLHKNEEAKLNQTIDALRTASAVQSADRKLVANTDAALQELLLNIPEVIRIVDVAMKRTLYMGPAAEGLFGQPFEEFITTRVPGCHTPQRRPGKKLQGFLNQRHMDHFQTRLKSSTASSGQMGVFAGFLTGEFSFATS